MRAQITEAVAIYSGTFAAIGIIAYVVVQLLSAATYPIVV